MTFKGLHLNVRKYKLNSFMFYIQLNTVLSPLSIVICYFCQESQHF